MRVQKKPLLTIKNVWLVDAVRAAKSRIMNIGGSVVCGFTYLRNLVPYGKDIIGKLRTGFSTYAGVTAPTGMEITLIKTIQNPSQEDIHVHFCDDTTLKEYVNPYWRGSTKATTSIDSGGSLRQGMLITESKAFSTGTGTVSNNTLTITNPGDLELSPTADYYNGWIVKNSTQSNSALIKDYSQSTNSVFTFVDNVQNLSWSATDTYIMYRNFHNNLTFAPTYNGASTCYSYPPCISEKDNVIRWSGGCYYAETGTTAAGNVGVVYYPYLKRVFFPGNANTYTFEGSYITEQRLRAFAAKADIIDTTTKLYLNNGDPGKLPIGKYWIAFAPIYNGYQIGELLTFEDAGDYDYTTETGSEWTANYNAGDDGSILVPFSAKVQLFDKRITGVAVYLAYDSTNTTVRVAPYKFVDSVSFITSAGGFGPTASFSDTENDWIIQYFQINDLPTGVTYEEHSGMSEYPDNITYSYSIDEWVGIRRFISNVYISSESQIDRKRIFTNPVGIFSGLPSHDAFPYSGDNLYCKDTEPTVGTKVTSLKAMGYDELLVGKDYGILTGRMYDNGDGTIDFNWQIIDKYAGVANVNGFTDGDGGRIYFIGYNDVYCILGNTIQPLIERPDAFDWLNTYRTSVTAANKEVSMMFYLPELNCLYLFFGIDGSTFGSKQYAYYPDIGWRQLTFTDSSNVVNVTLKWPNKLQNGHTICITNAATPALVRMVWSGASYTYVDGANTIKPYFDTGYVIFSGDEGVDTLIDKWVITKTLTSSTTTGTLDIGEYCDSGSLATYSAKSKTDTRLELYHTPSMTRMGQQWRLMYNTNADTLEVLNTGSLFQIDALEVYGKFIPRRRTGE